MTKERDTAPKASPSTKTHKTRQTKAVISDKDKCLLTFETWKQELLKKMPGKYISNKDTIKRKASPHE